MKKFLLLVGATLFLVGVSMWLFSNNHWVRVESDHPGYEISATPALKNYLDQAKFWGKNGVWDTRGQRAVTARVLTIRLVEQEQEGDRIVVDGATLTSMSYQENKGWITLTIGLNDSVIKEHNREPSATVNLAVKRAVQHALYHGVESFEDKMRRVGEGAKGGDKLVEVSAKTSNSVYRRVIALIVPKAYAQYTWQCGVPATDYRCNGGANNNTTCTDNDQCPGGSCDENVICTFPYIEESSPQCTQGCPPGRCYEPSGLC